MAITGNFLGTAKRIAVGTFTVKAILKDDVQGNFKFNGQLNPDGSFVGTCELIKLNIPCPAGCVAANPIDASVPQPFTVSGKVAKRNVLWAFFNNQVISGQFTEAGSVSNATGDPAVTTSLVNIALLVGAGFLVYKYVLKNK